MWTSVVLFGQVWSPGIQIPFVHRFPRRIVWRKMAWLRVPSQSRHAVNGFHGVPRPTGLPLFGVKEKEIHAVRMAQLARCGDLITEGGGAGGDKSRLGDSISPHCVRRWAAK